MIMEQTVGEFELPLEVRRKRLILRAKQRSMREVNLILSSFITTVLPTLNTEDMIQAELLLNAEDEELYMWVLNPASAPSASRMLVHSIRETLPTKP